MSGGLSAATYSHWRATTLGGITERVETRVVFDLAGPLRGRRVLDVGTGDGAYAIEAASRGALVTATNSEGGMLRAAQARSRQRGLHLSLTQARAESLPFADLSFDLVFAITVLCFVEDAPRAMREMARVLTPGGRLILGELDRYSVWAAERRVRAWLGASLWREARFRSRADLVRLGRGAGLRVGGVRGAAFFPPFALAARAMAPLEPLLTRLNTPGAAFLAMAADKSRAGSRFAAG